jgi:hypothetical protein
MVEGLEALQINLLHVCAVELALMCWMERDGETGRKTLGLSSYPQTRGTYILGLSMRSKDTEKEEERECGGNILLMP